eukprot:6206384-Pleurochrysis_carterae.AAC.4
MTTVISERAMKVWQPLFATRASVINFHENCEPTSPISRRAGGDEEGFRLCGHAEQGGGVRPGVRCSSTRSLAEQSKRIGSATAADTHYSAI